MGEITLYKIYAHVFQTGIIEKMIETEVGFRNDKIKLPILMFADDGLLVAESLGDIRKLIKTANEVSVDLGMKINREKSMAITVNYCGTIDSIEGIRIVESIKYLGSYYL